MGSQKGQGPRLVSMKHQHHIDKSQSTYFLDAGALRPPLGQDAAFTLHRAQDFDTILHKTSERG
jgi:hypothetical protein